LGCWGTDCWDGISGYVERTGKDNCDLEMLDSAAGVGKKSTRTGAVGSRRGDASRRPKVSCCRLRPLGEGQCRDGSLLLYPCASAVYEAFAYTRTRTVRVPVSRHNSAMTSVRFSRDQSGSMLGRSRRGKSPLMMFIHHCCISLVQLPI
jgi:hypothetical protein